MKKFLTHLSLISLLFIGSFAVLNGTENKDFTSSLKEKSKIVFTKDNLIQIKDPAGICVLVKEFYKNTFDKNNNTHTRPFDQKLFFEKKVSVHDRELYFSPLYFAMQDFLNGINNTDTGLLEAAKRIYNYDHQLFSQEKTLVMLNGFIYDAILKLRQKFIGTHSGSEYNNLMFRVLISLYNNGFNQDGSIKDLLLLKIANYLLIINNYTLERLQNANNYHDKDNEEYINECFALRQYILPLKINISTLTGRTKDETTINNLKEDLHGFLSILNLNTKKKTEERNSEVANINFQYNNNLNIILINPQFNKVSPDGRFNNTFIDAIVNQQYPLRWDQNTFKATVDGIEIDLGQLENPEALKAAFYEKEFIKIVKLLNNAAQQNPDEYGDFTRIADLIKNDVLQMPADILTKTAQPTQTTLTNTASTTAAVPVRKTLAPLQRPIAKQQVAESATTIVVPQNLPASMLQQPQASAFNQEDYFCKDKGFHPTNILDIKKIKNDLIQALLWNNQYSIKMNNPTLVADIIKMLYEKNNNNEASGVPKDFLYETTITEFDKKQYSHDLEKNAKNKSLYGLLNNLSDDLWIINSRITSIMSGLMWDINDTLKENNTKFLTNAYAHKAMRIIISLYVNGFDQSGNVKDLLSIKLANYIILFLKNNINDRFEKLLSSLSTALKDNYQDENGKSLDERISDLIFNLNKQAAGKSTKEWLANPTFGHQFIFDKRINYEKFADTIINQQNPLRWDQDTFKATINGYMIDLGQLENPEIIKADFYKKEFIKIAQWLYNAAQLDPNEYGNFTNIADLIINNLLQMPANTLTKTAATNAQPAILAAQKTQVAAASAHDRQFFAQDYKQPITSTTAVVSSKSAAPAIKAQPAAPASQPIVNTDDRRVKGKQPAIDEDEEVIALKPAVASAKKTRAPIVKYVGDEVSNLPPVASSTPAQQKQEDKKAPVIQQQITQTNVANTPKKIGPTVPPKSQAASASAHNRQIFAQDYPKQASTTAVVSSKPAAPASQPIINTDDDDRRVKGKQAAPDEDEEVITLKPAELASAKKPRAPIVKYVGDKVFNLPPVASSTPVQQKQEDKKTPVIQQQITQTNVANAPKRVGPTVPPKPQAQQAAPVAAPIVPEITAQPTQPIVFPVPAAPIVPENVQPQAQPAGIVDRLWQGTKNVAQTVGNLLTEEASSSDEEDNGFGLFNELINKNNKNDYFVNNNKLNQFLLDFGSAEDIIAIAKTACHAVASSNNYNKLFAGAIIRSLITLTSCYKTNPNPATAQLITDLINHASVQEITKGNCPAGSLSKLAAQAPIQPNQQNLYNTITNFTTTRK